MADAAPTAILVSSMTAYEATLPTYHAAIAFIVIDTLIVALRFISRFVIRRLPFWWDDFWIIPAYLMNLGERRLLGPDDSSPFTHV